MFLYKFTRIIIYITSHLLFSQTLVKGYLCTPITWLCSRMVMLCVRSEHRRTSVYGNPVRDADDRVPDIKDVDNTHLSQQRQLHQQLHCTILHLSMQGRIRGNHVSHLPTCYKSHTACPNASLECQRCYQLIIDMLIAPSVTKWMNVSHMENKCNLTIFILNSSISAVRHTSFDN